MRGLRELQDGATDQHNSAATATLTIDRDTASRLGIHPQLIEDTLSDPYGQRYSAQYFTLGMLCESYIHPLTILSTLPSAGVGALLILIIFRYDLSVIALIGILLLIGIVKKNAIMMIDFAFAAERRDGLPPEESIFQACMLRFRPIMMTTMAALLGGLPLMLGEGTGSELRRPLGFSIVGGPLLSQVLTLYTTPAVYLYMDRLSAWVTGARRAPRQSTAQRVLSPRPADSV